MVPGDGKRVCILIGGGPQTGETIWQIEGVAYPVIVGPASHPPAPQAWKAQQRQLPKFLR
jgi:hypothetical protein